MLKEKNSWLIKVYMGLMGWWLRDVSLSQPITITKPKQLMPIRRTLSYPSIPLLHTLYIVLMVFFSQNLFMNTYNYYKEKETN